jgi:hypothetical protein
MPVRQDPDKIPTIFGFVGYNYFNGAVEVQFPTAYPRISTGFEDRALWNLTETSEVERS